MNFQFDEDAANIQVKMSGDLNFAANNEFKAIIDKLAAVKGKRVTFDLAGIGRVDSVGLGLLYIAKEEVGAAGGRIRLKSANAGIIKMLQLTETEADFDIVA